MSNVILGPWATSKSINVAQDEQVRTLHVQQIVADISGDLFDELAYLGFDIDNSDELDYTKDIAIVVESIRSFIMKLNGNYHPVQELAEDLFEETGDGLLRTLPELQIRFSATVEPPSR
jgi:hypothetical protein